VKGIAFCHVAVPEKDSGRAASTRDVEAFFKRLLLHTTQIHAKGPNWVVCNSSLFLKRFDIASTGVMPSDARAMPTEQDSMLQD